MAAKDLYTILQIPPTATMADVKKAYRKLALQYHPDKNPYDEIAAERFLEIKKAYEVLGDVAKRQQYTYDNWQQKRSKSKPYQQPVSPQFILQKITGLAQHVSTIDVFRMSHEALYSQTISILSAENIAVLQQFQDREVNKKIIEAILKTIKPLPFGLIKKLEPVLVKIAHTDNEILSLIFRFIKRKKQIDFWERYNVVIILIITVLICLIIFIAGK